MRDTNGSGPHDGPDTPDPVEYDLFNLPPDPVVRAIITGRARTLTERFEAFHAANPGVYLALRQVAREYLAETGAATIGVQMLMEVFRWKIRMRTRSAEFKINNDFGAFYGRLMMATEPDLAGAFETRRADEADAWAAANFSNGRAA